MDRYLTEFEIAKMSVTAAGFDSGVGGFMREDSSTRQQGVKGRSVRLSCGVFDASNLQRGI